MKRSVAYLVTAIFILIAAMETSGQKRIFKHYSIEDGLADPNVYFTFQDSKGFMWFATEQGLTQFDGTHFRTYTTRDGLPANEVLQMCEDSMGRLWMICYSSQSCFMYKGVIHNSENDPLLKHIDSESSFFRDITIDSQGGVWIYGPKVYRVYNDKVFSYKLPNDKTVIGMGYLNHQFTAAAYTGLYAVKLSGTEISYKLLVSLDEKYQTKSVFANGNCYLMEAGSEIRLLIIKPTLDVDTLDVSGMGIKEVIGSFSTYSPRDSLFLFSSSSHGIMAYNQFFSGKAKAVYEYLPKNTAFSRICFDREGNTWISTLGAGVIFIPLYETYLYKLNKQSQNQAVTSLHQFANKQLIAGFENSFAISRDTGFRVYAIPIPDSGVFTRKRVIRLCNWGRDDILIGTDFGLYTVNNHSPTKVTRITHECIKNIVSISADSVLIAANTHTFCLTHKQGAYALNVLADIRSTALTIDKEGTVWLGMLNGLFMYKNKKMVRFDKNDLINKSRITDLLTDEYGNIWIATHQRGIFVISGDSMISISTANGLPEDACTRFFKEADGKIWICTNRHVCSIAYKQQKHFTYTILKESGLFELNAIVNDVYVDSATIWIASSNGLLRLNRNRKVIPAPLVYITALNASNAIYNGDSFIGLKHFQNDIQIDYVGISYNSNGHVAYKYVINNADTVYTLNTSISFSTMAPGNYRLKVWAQNSLGLWSSNPAEVVFEIFPPFWKTWWFNSLVLAIAVFTIWAYIRWRIRRIKIQEAEKTSLNKKMAETQLHGLRAQINEHFIFNSLNAIQGFINQNELKAANFFLAALGKLIRRTLDISFSPVISLQEEIDYLENYLLLEKIRYDGRFHYKITNEITTISTFDVILPSMILQPYVENAIRHGLRHKSDGMGFLNISFTRHNEFITCSIADNGIGRERATELKQKLHIEYQSRGMNLSAERISLFNKTQLAKISVTIEDGAEGIGTIVKVTVPLSFNL